ncbi:MAG: LemA family protein [bacterium]|jgi:LemA protein|nr:LemA family protein [bacterium]MDD3806188.1 LemA family protein [bacterium]MDD4153169.1 LemA family protein [bacterium]MDD4559040.1 LemA family protein [bacterium]
MISLLVIVALVVLLALVIIGIYNGLVIMRTRVEEAWSDIDVQLKRRHDLIPNLVETVKGYARHEAGVFENVTQARAAAVSAGSVGEKAQAENMLTGALRSLFAVAEAYPELRASENFTRLQEDLADTENKIMASRRFYNGVTRDYNIRRETFPSNIVANAFGFTRRDFFEIEDEASRENVEVKFD